MIGLLEMALLSGALLTSLAWAATVFFAPRLTLTSAPTHVRTMWGRLWLYAPVWIPAVVLLAAVIPGLLGEVFGWQDHCLADSGHHHHHLCLIHPPHISSHPLSLVMIVASLLPGLFLVGSTAYKLLKESRLIRSLVRSSTSYELGDDIRLLDREEPIALTVGAFRPTILLSTGLIATTSETTLRVIIAHERAHVLRRDTTVAVLDRLVASLLPARVRAHLQHHLSLAREQACDAAAAREEGALHVASALTQVARLNMAQPSIGLSVGTSSLEARVLHLLERPASQRWWPAWPVAFVVALVVTSAGPIHHVIERLIALLLH